MDTPAENKEGYEFGSVMTHAKNLKGVLFIEHGDLDDNVHMQNSVQLIDALMDEGKDFDFTLFPNQRHGYGGKKRRRGQPPRRRFLVQAPPRQVKWRNPRGALSGSGPVRPAAAAGSAPTGKGRSPAG